MVPKVVKSTRFGIVIIRAELVDKQALKKKMVDKTIAEQEET